MENSSYTNVIQAYAYVGLSYERWNISRTSGNYLVREFTADKPIEHFRAFSKALKLTYEMSSEDDGMAKGSLAYLTVRGSKLKITFNESIETEVISLIKKTPPASLESFVKWWFITKEGPESAELPLIGDDPKQEFYPWMTKSIDQFADEFMKSAANVMLLIGLPGTGKTSFVRGLVRRMRYETWVTYDKKVQENEQFYVRFASISGDDKNGRVLVMEDSDEMISKRKDGNELMNRILNISDGIVTLPARKIIFSTNLPGMSHVDEALVRPGRCFAAIKFRMLTTQEAERACHSIGLKLENNIDRMTLSQALNNKQDLLQVQQIGFGPDN